MKQDYNTHILSRVINILLKIIIKDYDYLASLSNQELINIMTMLGMKTKTSNIEKDKLIKSIIIKTTIESDIYYTFLSFLQEQIEDPKQKYLQEKLITAKYYMIYVNKNIESLTLTNTFNIQTTTYINSKIVSDLLKIDSDLYEKSKNLIGATIANSEIYELLEITDFDYNDISKVSTSILRQCMLNAALQFINDETLNEIKNELYEFTEDIEYQSIHANSSISSSIINYCFTSITKNKAKIQTLSLK